MMHAAKIEASDRLQRAHALLCDGAWHSTRDIVMNAEVMAVSAVVSELRANGFTIHCRVGKSPKGARIFEYRLELDGLLNRAGGQP